MKKLFFVFLIICLIQSQLVFATDIPSVPVETDEDVEIECSLPVDKIIKGDVVYLDVKLNKAYEVYAYELCLEYDSDFLKYKGLKDDVSDESDILFEDNKDGELMIVFSEKGDAEIKGNRKVSTLEFSSLKSGNTTIIVKSVKLVFEDMTYLITEELDYDVDVSIRSKKVQSGGGGGGGGSRPSGTSGIKISGGDVTTSGISIPAEPEIIPEAKEEADKNEFFSDVDKEHWAYQYIASMAEKGIINGFEDNTFKPEESITRAEFAKMIMTGEVVENSSDTTFFDVDENVWYYDAVCNAASVGLICGVGDGRFLPDENITREEAAVIMYRFAEYKNKSLLPFRMNINFDDEEDISDFAVGSIDALYTAEVINGSDDGNFYPKKSISRAESATMIYNLLSIIEKEN